MTVVKKRKKKQQPFKIPPIDVNHFILCVKKMRESQERHKMTQMPWSHQEKLELELQVDAILQIHFKSKDVCHSTLRIAGYDKYLNE